MRFMLAAIFAVFFAGQAYAASNEKTASEFIDKLGNQVVEIVSNKANSPDARSKKLEAIFDKNIDINWISHFVLGKNARRITNEQKPRYETAYHKYLVKTYVSRFSEYSGEVMKVISTRKDDGDFVVEAQIVRPKSENIGLQFFVRFDKNNPQIFDVVIEGVSQLNTQRSEFDSIINRDGVDGLIAKLEANVAAGVAPAAQPAQ